MLINFDALLKARETSVSSPRTNEPVAIELSPVENVGLSTLVFDDAVDTIALPTGTIAAGTFLYIKSDIDIELFVGAASVTPVKGSFFVINLITVANSFSELHIRNNNGAGETATVDYFIAGDLA